MSRITKDEYESINCKKAVTVVFIEAINNSNTNTNRARFASLLSLPVSTQSSFILAAYCGPRLEYDTITLKDHSLDSAVAYATQTYPNAVIVTET